MKFLTPLLITTLLLSSCSNNIIRKLTSAGQTPYAVEQLVTWETKANGVAVRSNQIFDLNHYEIPLDLLSSEFASDLSQDIKDSLIFEKNGEAYVRWLINPEDTKWHLEVKKMLDEAGLDSTVHSYLKGYLTASRSMIAFNPENGSAFSVKVSTNNTGGYWNDKKQTWDDANQIRKISDWVKDTLSKMDTKSLVIQDEPLGLGIESLDQGLIVRNLNDVPTGKHYYLPGFSALHETEGKLLAQLNGSTDVVKFWEDNYVRPLAKAMAEFSALTGVYYDSPHSQNFMIELDENKKPTGRVVLRDFGDSYLNRDFVSQTAHASILNIWEKDNIVSGKFPTAVGLLHGNSAPSWLTLNDYKRYGETFYKEYEKKFSEISGIPLTKLQQRPIAGARAFSYLSKAYPTEGDDWKRFFDHANCLGGAETTLSGQDCGEFFTKFQKQDNCFGAVQSFAQ
ncbi:putative lipoprotein [Bacteriovorax sp. Seq25_V]|uniref:putative lipoprotein n=1 Tax=Bacteriovorax sp. Seq25_V TaxID=1201288 RepID=UPI00038A26F7|nr:putative lipoprotein [Bacteriovorax sp. Seq25_V]EQC46266.1 putative lipoprotein [Bacteriovorax sp. Seq25_V]